MNKILIIDSDEKLLKEASYYFNSSNLILITCDNVADAINVITKEKIDLLVLELFLPNCHQSNAILELRRHTACPIVILSVLSQLPKRLESLNAGANYYLVKPTPMEELKAVINNILSKESGDNKYKWKMNPTMQTLVGVNGHWVYLTAEEWILIKTIRAEIGKVVSRKTLTIKLGKDLVTYDQRSMNNILSRIRTKAKMAGLGRLPVSARYGKGYVWIE